MTQMISERFTRVSFGRLTQFLSLWDAGFGSRSCGHAVLIPEEVVVAEAGAARGVM